MILSSYGKIRVRENPRFGIVYAVFLLNCRGVFELKYSRMDQVKFVEDSL